jgi:hypothetical protein
MTGLEVDNWGNKPLVIIISIVASIITIVVFFSGRQSINEFVAQPTRILPSPVVITVYAITPSAIPTNTPITIYITATNVPIQNQENEADKIKSNATISDQVGEVNLRRSPGYLGKNDDTDVIVKIPQFALVEIIGGPIDKDSLSWWNVSWSGHEGWIADHTGNGRTIMVFNP